MNATEVLALIEISDKRFYVYELRRPDTTPFYVGAGKGKRLFDHERRAYERQSRGHKNSLIRKILRDGESIDYRIVKFYETWEEAVAEEIRLIAHYGRVDKGTGFLLNLTDGGDGIVGIDWKFTEARQEGSKRAAERERSEEERKRMSESAKKRGSDPFIEGARKWREQNMEQLIEERRARWEDEEFVARHSASMENPKTRSLLSQRMQERLADPEQRKKIVRTKGKPQRIPVIVNGVIYRSAHAAGRALGVSETTIRNRIKRGEAGYSYPVDTFRLL